MPAPGFGCFRFAYGVPWKGTVHQRVGIPPGKLSLPPVAIGAELTRFSTGLRRDEQPDGERGHPHWTRPKKILAMQMSSRPIGIQCAEITVAKGEFSQRQGRIYNRNRTYLWTLDSGPVRSASANAGGVHIQPFRLQPLR